MLKENKFNYVFTDETLICNVPSNKMMSMVRREAGGAYEEQHLRQAKQPSAKVMLWLYICSEGKGEVFIAENNRLWDDRGNKLNPKPPPKNKGFDNLSYTDLVERRAIPSIRSKLGNASNWTFVQDNSPVHTSKEFEGNTIFDVFDRNNVSYIIDWPALSPDLHPVENAHKLLKDQMNRELARLVRKPNTKNRLLSLAELCWDRVDNDQIKKIYQSFENRLKLCILHHGNNNFSTNTSSKANRATLAKWNDQLLEAST